MAKSIEFNIKVIIVDDEPFACKRISMLLNDYTNVDIVGVCENGQEAIKQIIKRQPDLVFLDVQMPEINGFDVLQKIEKSDIDMPVIIFVTAYNEYALKAFEVHALDYLLKPFNKKRFKDSFERAKKVIVQGKKVSLNKKIDNLLEYLDANQQPQSRILVKTSDRYFFLADEEVDWIESEGNYVRIHSGEKDYLIRETMINMEKKLDPNLFFRIHRSTIVNIDKIKEIEPWFHGDYKVTLHNGKQLTLSRNYKELLNRFS